MWIQSVAEVAQPRIQGVLSNTRCRRGTAPQRVSEFRDSFGRYATRSSGSVEEPAGVGEDCDADSVRAQRAAGGVGVQHDAGAAGARADEEQAAGEAEGEEFIKDGADDEPAGEGEGGVGAAGAGAGPHVAGAVGQQHVGGGVPERVGGGVGGEQRGRAAGAGPARGGHERGPAPPTRRARRRVPAVPAALQVHHPVLAVATSTNVVAETWWKS